MTEQTTRLRRFDDLWPRCLLALSCLLGTSHGLSATAPQPRVPVLQTVGVLPVQWEGEIPAKAEVAAAFPRAVRASHKFRVLNDDLVEGLWQEAAGRSELKSEYELQAFVGLTASLRADLVTLSARITDAALKTVLLETDVVTLDWLANATAPELQERLDTLVFRLINRLPVDVSVTSVQGSFITLSGGSDQNIEVGDKVDLVRATVRSLHPANGTWLEFKKQPLGTAQIIEVKTYNSVAKILSQTYEHAIEVGDGARISALASRVKFSRLAANDGLKDSGNQETIIVAPLYTGEAASKKAAKEPAKPTVAASESAPSSKDEAPAAEPPSEPAAATPAAEPPPDQGEVPPPPSSDEGQGQSQGNFLDDLLSDAGSHKLIDEINVYAGPYWWSLSGSNVPAAAGNFPWYLLNSFGGGITHTLLYKIKTAFGGGLLFGKTGDGNYMGYQGYARLYWEDTLAIGGGVLSGWRAGGLGYVSGMAIDHGAYGGGDWLRGGGFGGLFGKFSVGDKGERYDWYGEFALMPLTIGRGGYSGSRQEVQSSFGTIISLGAFQDRPARIIALGAGLDVNNEVQTLNDGRRPHYQSFQLKAMAKYAL